MQQNSFDFVSESPSVKKDNVAAPSPAIPVAARDNSVRELHEVPLREDGGVRAIQGFEYQHHVALTKCLELLSYPEKYEYVSIETHNDVVTRCIDGVYEFYQVKLRGDQYWSIADLNQLGVWSSFLKLQRDFGIQSRFFFVSSQAPKRGKAPNYNLAQMKDITRMGKDRCKVKDVQIADSIIGLLEECLTDEQASRSEIEYLFWNTRILTDYEHEAGLEAQNLLTLIEILSNRGVICDAYNAKQIYKNIRDLIVDRLKPQPELSIVDLMLRRQLYYVDINEKVQGAFSSIQVGQFTINHETDPKTLIEKTEIAGFPTHFRLYFLESRNYFSLRLRDDYDYAAEYLRYLRRKVWDVCVDGQIQVTNLPALTQYRKIRGGLKKLAEIETLKDSPVQIDFDYLHGMLCQLTAECHHDWLKIPNSGL